MNCAPKKDTVEKLLTAFRTWNRESLPELCKRIRPKLANCDPATREAFVDRLRPDERELLGIVLRNGAAAVVQTGGKPPGCRGVWKPAFAMKTGLDRTAAAACFEVLAAWQRAGGSYDNIGLPQESQEYLRDNPPDFSGANTKADEPAPKTETQLLANLVRQGNRFRAALQSRTPELAPKCEELVRELKGTLQARVAAAIARSIKNGEEGVQQDQAAAE